MKIEKSHAAKRHYILSEGLGYREQHGLMDDISATRFNLLVELQHGLLRHDNPDDDEVYDNPDDDEVYDNPDDDEVYDNDEDGVGVGDEINGDADSGADENDEP